MKIHFCHADGHQDVVESEDSVSVMEAAVKGGVEGIDADCGGQLSCATCHVFVDAAWLPKLLAMSADEDALLELAPGRDERSRLCCQIRCTPGLDGLSVEVPESQH